jgi:translation initiation factor IF-2
MGRGLGWLQLAILDVVDRETHRAPEQMRARGMPSRDIAAAVLEVWDEDEVSTPEEVWLSAVRRAVHSLARRKLLRAAEERRGRSHVLVVYRERRAGMLNSAVGKRAKSSA